MVRAVTPWDRRSPAASHQLQRSSSSGHLFPTRTGRSSPKASHRHHQQQVSDAAVSPRGRDHGPPMTRRQSSATTSPLHHSPEHMPTLAWHQRAGMLTSAAAAGGGAETASPTRSGDQRSPRRRSMSRSSVASRHRPPMAIRADQARIALAPPHTAARGEVSGRVAQRGVPPHRQAARRNSQAWETRARPSQRPSMAQRRPMAVARARAAVSQSPPPPMVGPSVVTRPAMVKR